MDISVIIPTFQMEKYIARAVRSTLSQSIPRRRYEVIIVDDGSTDNTEHLLRAFEGEIRVIRHEANRGLAAARNSGLRAAQGKYVVNLDADDYMHSDLLNIESLFLSLNADIDAVSCDYFTVDERGNHLVRSNASRDPIACGIMFRMDQLIEIGLYDEGFLVREDEDLMIRFTEKYSIYHVPLPLYRYRQHEGNITKQTGLMKKYREEIRKKHRR